jgi:hypothetical protein
MSVSPFYANKNSEVRGVGVSKVLYWDIFISSNLSREKQIWNFNHMRTVPGILHAVAAQEICSETEYNTPPSQI